MNKDCCDKYSAAIGQCPYDKTKLEACRDNTKRCPKCGAKFDYLGNEIR